MEVGDCEENGEISEATSVVLEGIFGGEKRSDDALLPRLGGEEFVRLLGYLHSFLYLFLGSNIFFYLCKENCYECILEVEIDICGIGQVL